MGSSWVYYVKVGSIQHSKIMKKFILCTTLALGLAAVITAGNRQTNASIDNAISAVNISPQLGITDQQKWDIAAINEQGITTANVRDEEGNIGATDQAFSHSIALNTGTTQITSAVSEESKAALVTTGRQEGAVVNMVTSPTTTHTAAVPGSTWNVIYIAPEGTATNQANNSTTVNARDHAIAALVQTTNQRGASFNHNTDVPQALEVATTA